GFPAAFDKISLQFSNLRVVKLHSSYLSKLCIEALGWLFHFSPNVESLSIVIPGPLKPDDEIYWAGVKPDNENYWAGVSLTYKLDHLRSVEIR
ncbi:hypothetical protein MKW94_003093, partial [Papaver nudicaule]|nr:hypothetical protein [Papaver nudicaule]